MKKYLLYIIAIIGFLVFIPKVNALEIKPAHELSYQEGVVKSNLFTVADNVPKYAQGELDMCEMSGPLKLIRAVKILIMVAQYAVPLILIFTMSLDIYNLVSDPGNKGKVFPVIKNRLIAALLVFIIPTALDILLGMLGKDTDVSRCYNNATKEYIESVEASENSN